MNVDEQAVNFLQTIFDSRYRKVDDCNDIMVESDHRQDRTEKTLAEGVTKLNILIAILVFIASALVPVVIKVLFG